MLRHVPNALTVLRLGLAFAFPFVAPERRLAVVLVALATEYLDGALARAFRLQSELGVLLDPVADKLFFASAIGTFVFEGRVSVPQVLALAIRDAATALFALALIARGRWSSFKGLRPGALGKVTTTLQYAAFFFPLLGKPLPSWLVAATALCGAGAAADYLRRYRRRLGY